MLQRETTRPTRLAEGAAVRSPQTARRNAALQLTLTASALRVRTIASVKRSIDLLGSLVLVAFAAPLMVMIAVLIRLESRGPVFYTQRRVQSLDADGTLQQFTMIKFRSMRVDAERASGPTTAGADDPRVTRVGRFLRRTRLDELPQLFNVLLGDMSLVGPRPERAAIVRTLARVLPYYEERSRGVKPGITGLAQINLGYNGSVITGTSGERLARVLPDRPGDGIEAHPTSRVPQEVAGIPIEGVRLKLLYDLAYLAQMNRLGTYLLTELKIICKTPVTMVRGTGI